MTLTEQLATARPRSDGWTWARQQRFLALLAETGSVRHAAETVGMSQSSAYRLRSRQGPEFEEAWKRATRVSYRALRESAMQRAINGTEVPVYSRGEQVGTRTVHDERLVMFLLKTRGGRRFGDEDFAADDRYDEIAAKRFGVDQFRMDLYADIIPEAVDSPDIWGKFDEVQEALEREADADIEREKAGEGGPPPLERPSRT